MLKRYAFAQGGVVATDAPNAPILVFTSPDEAERRYLVEEYKLDEHTLNAAIEPQVEGPDAVLMFPIPFALGFMRHSNVSPMLGHRSFGHYGAGGSVGLADPDRRIGVGYVMNQMHFGIAGDPRTAGLLAAIDACVS